MWIGHCCTVACSASIDVIRMSGADGDPDLPCCTRKSPLTYASIFGSILPEFLMKKKQQYILEFQTVKKIDTPKINQQLLLPRGLAPVESSTKFKELYKEGREKIRSIKFNHQYHNKLLVNCLLLLHGDEGKMQKLIWSMYIRQIVWYTPCTLGWFFFLMPIKLESGKIWLIQ